MKQTASILGFRNYYGYEDNFYDMIIVVLLHLHNLLIELNIYFLGFLVGSFDNLAPFFWSGI